MKANEKVSSAWRVIFDEEAATRALARINELFPLKAGEGPSPERQDMLGWYRRWVVDLDQDPFQVLGAPPMRTDLPNIARFPADESKPVSGIADVDWAARTITVIEIHIRPPKRSPS